MSRLSYKYYRRQIKAYIEEHGLKSVYGFAELSKPELHEPWAIDRTTLEDARRKGELFCHGTMIEGRWLLDWVFKTDEERREFANSPLARQLRKNAA